MHRLFPPAPGSAGGTAGKPPVPGTGALLGMISENTAVTPDQSWAADCATLGLTPEFQSWYYHTDTPFPGTNVKTTLPLPPVVMVTWYGWPDAQVNAGLHDSTILARAAALRRLRRPVFLRWDIEMNIDTYGYEPTGGAPAGGPTFIQAWQRVHGLFAQAKASNVAFVWCPNCNSPYDPDSWRPFWPGDAYVDWAGVDGYNWGNSNLPSGSSTWQTAFQIFGAFITDWQGGFGGVSAGKPLMIGETGCYDGGGSKSWWYTDLSGYLHQSGVKCLTLFNTNQSSLGVNWRWDSDAAATEAAIELANAPYFGGKSAKGNGYDAAVLALTPYAYWKLDEIAGSYADSSGNGLTAAVAGSASTRGCITPFPGAGYAYSMYGSGYVDLGAVGTFGSAMSSGFTVLLCFKDGNNGAGPATIVGQLNTGTATGLMVNANQDHTLAGNPGHTLFWLRTESGTTHYAEITANLYDGNWHQVAWVCNPAGTDAVYIDGASVTLAASSGATAGATANFGFDPFLGGRNNRGSIDQECTAAVSRLALFKAQLSAGQVAALHTALVS